jgi:type I restriction enzyme R subunit
VRGGDVGEDKDFGYIVDYKDLFKKVENAIAVYTSELDHSAGGSAIEYEEYLKRIANLARSVEAGLADDTPEPLKKSPALRALYNNLKKGGTAGDTVLNLALKIDAAVKRARPDGWRGVHAREQIIKGALNEILQDGAEVERIFLIVKAQSEY